jgi:HPt (histidine-containing phosphotransfer) domain-containing protein
MILTDISMPRMDGLEATRHIRREGASRNVPIIGVTANASPEKMPEFLGAGMTDVLVKPITRNALMAIIANYARGATRSRPRGIAAAETGVPLLNPDVFNETIEEMGRDFVERIADRLLHETESVIVQLHDLGNAGAFEDAGKAAHKTAGAAAAIGLSGLHSALASYERAAQAKDGGGTTAALAEVRRVLPGTVAELRAHGLSLALSRAAAE